MRRISFFFYLLQVLAGRATSSSDRVSCNTYLSACTFPRGGRLLCRRVRMALLPSIRSSVYMCCATVCPFLLLGRRLLFLDYFFFSLV